jgi:hypothetical protein
MQMWKAKNASHIYTATTAVATGQSRSQTKTGKLQLSVVEKTGAGQSVLRESSSANKGTLVGSFASSATTWLLLESCLKSRLFILTFVLSVQREHCYFVKVRITSRRILASIALALVDGGGFPLATATST